MSQQEAPGQPRSGPIEPLGRVTSIKVKLGLLVVASVLVAAVLATLGAHGAVLVTAEGAWHAAQPPTEVVSTVGAGDSSLFGYVLGVLRELDPAHRLALAVAYGSAAAGLPGTTIPQPPQVRPDLVVVRPLPTPLESDRSPISSPQIWSVSTPISARTSTT